MTLWKHIFYDLILIFQQIFWLNRSSRSQIFFKIGILKNFAIITGKQLCWTAELKVCSFIKQRLQHNCFHVNAAKFLRTAFFIKHLQWLLLNEVKTNVKSTWYILLPDWLYHVIKPIMTSNSNLLQNYKDKEAETQRNRNTKN